MGCVVTSIKDFVIYVKLYLDNILYHSITYYIIIYSWSCSYCVEVLTVSLTPPLLLESLFSLLLFFICSNTLCKYVNFVLPDEVLGFGKLVFINVNPWRVILEIDANP
jgi:hypothetical protein